jgi:hypothetical protein
MTRCGLVTTWATDADGARWAEAIDTGIKLIITINIIKNRNVTYFNLKNSTLKQSYHFTLCYLLLFSVSFERILHFVSHSARRAHSGAPCTGNCAGTLIGARYHN